MLEMGVGNFKLKQVTIRIVEHRDLKVLFCQRIMYQSANATIMLHDKANQHSVA